jgi:hypothetical protein
VITITGRDAAGNIGTDVLTITYSTPTTPPPAPVTLSGQFDPWARNKRRALLSWTTAPWSGVAIYRNGGRIATTVNDGAYTDSVRTSGTYTYKACDPNNAAVCSNTVTLYY